MALNIWNFAESFSQVTLDISLAGKTDRTRWWLDDAGNNWWNGKRVHNFDVVYYVREGTLCLSVNDTAYRFGSGDLILIPAGSVLECTADESAPLVKYYIHGSALLGKQPIIRTFGESNILHVGDNAELIDLFELVCCGKTRGIADIVPMHTAFLTILSFYVNYAATTDQPPDSDRKLADSIDYITTHYNEPITVSSLASRVGFTRDYFGKEFLRIYGFSPLRYLTRVRITAAKNLLTATDKPVAEIAREVGFSTVHYFSRVFARETGLPPLRYRWTTRSSNANP